MNFLKILKEKNSIQNSLDQNRLETVKWSEFEFINNLNISLPTPFKFSWPIILKLFPAPKLKLFQ